MARRPHKPTLRRLSGADIARARVYVCSWCGAWNERGHPDCLACKRPASWLVFDSPGEAKRWAELNLQLAHGMISELQRQVRLALLAPNPAGLPERVGHYVADFTYRDDAGQKIIEDYKGGAITDLAAWKLRHVAVQYGVTVKTT